MSKEILLKDYEETKKYYQEMAFMAETGVLDFIKRFLELKNQSASIKISPEGKYFAEISWPTKIEDKKIIFGNFFSIMPNLEKESLIFAGKLHQELEKEDWANRKVMRKAIRGAFKNPAQRSNNPFYDSQVE